MQEFPHIITPATINLVIGNKAHSINKSHPNFNRVLAAIKSRHWSLIADLVDIPASIARYTKGLVEVHDNCVLYNGEELGNVVVDRILWAQKQGLPVTALVNFLQDLMLNPSYQSRQELYLFLEAAGCPITTKGSIIGWKAVKPDFTDYHSGTVDYTPGRTVGMTRGDVDDDRRKSCSFGLHVGSRKYAEGFVRTGGHILKVEFWPRDVVSVPHHGGDQKCRVCELTSLGISKDGPKAPKPIIRSARPHYVPYVGE